MTRCSGHASLGTPPIWFDGAMRRPVCMLLGVLALLCGAVLGLPTGTSAAAAACPTHVLAAADAAQQAQAVFTGVVGTPAKVDRSTHPKTFTYPVTVQQSLKGGATGATSVTTEGGACGIGRLHTGATYLFLVAARGQGWIAPGNLGSTDQALDTLVPQVQAAIAPPSVTFGAPLTGRPASFKRVAAPGFALILIGVLGLLFVRRPRRA